MLTINSNDVGSALPVRVFIASTTLQSQYKMYLRNAELYQVDTNTSATADHRDSRPTKQKKQLIQNKLNTAE